MSLSEVINLTIPMLHVILIVLGSFVVIFILKVYDLYRVMKINRSVMTPMLLAGFFTAISGITELTHSMLGEMGHFAHTIAMLAAAAFLAYGIYQYHQMLNRLSKLR